MHLTTRIFYWYILFFPTVFKKREFWVFEKGYDLIFFFLYFVSRVVRRWPFSGLFQMLKAVTVTYQNSLILIIMGYHWRLRTTFEAVFPLVKKTLIVVILSIIHTIWNLPDAAQSWTEKNEPKRKFWLNVIY